MTWAAASRGRCTRPATSGRIPRGCIPWAGGHAWSSPRASDEASGSRRRRVYHTPRAITSRAATKWPRPQQGRAVHQTPSDAGCARRLVRLEAPCGGAQGDWVRLVLVERLVLVVLVEHRGARVLLETLVVLVEHQASCSGTCPCAVPSTPAATPRRVSQSSRSAALTRSSWCAACGVTAWSLAGATAIVPASAACTDAVPASARYIAVSASPGPAAPWSLPRAWAQPAGEGSGVQGCMSRRLLSSADDWAPQAGKEKRRESRGLPGHSQGNPAKMPRTSSSGGGSRPGGGHGDGGDGGDGWGGRRGYGGESGSEMGRTSSAVGSVSEMGSDNDSDGAPEYGHKAHYDAQTSRPAYTGKCRHVTMAE
jgi:hypothetical protein